MTIVAALINALIIGFLVRKMLGVPVGWPRTILLSLIVNGFANALIRWVFERMGLGTWDGTSAMGLEIALVIGLVLAWVLAVEVLILAMLEGAFPTGSLPSPIAWIRGLPARRRRTRRYAQIVRIAVKHGLGGYLRPRSRIDDRPTSATARALREALTEGGVTFVKLGQMLATRPDLVAPAFVSELSRLHSDVPPEPWELVAPVIEAELGRPIEEVFADVAPEPMAAASVAQIHLGRLRDGQAVVLKVQRSKARDQAAADLDIVLRLASWLDRTTAWGRSLGVARLAQGFADSLHEELDYRVELENMQAVAAASTVDVRVPRPYPELSTSRLLVMEHMDGQALSRASLDRFSPQQREAMAQRLFAAVLRQIAVTGIFHADLHPGNIFISGNGDLALLDFGSVGRLDLSARTSLSTLLLAVDRQDAIAATDALIDLLDRPDALDDRALEREIGQLILRYGGGVGSGGTAAMFSDLFKVIVRHRFAVPPQVAAALRTLGALEGSLRLLSPQLDLVASARSQSHNLIREQLSPPVIRDRLESQLATILPVLQRLPRRVNRIAEELESGRFTINVRAFGHADDRAFLTGLVQQFVVAVLAAAVGIGGILLVTHGGGPKLGTSLSLYGFLGTVFLFFAFILGARSLVLVFRHGVTRRSPH